MAEPIEIIIRKGSGGEGTGFGVSGASGSGGRNTNFGNEADFLKQKTSGDAALKTAAGIALGALKRSINYGISQYGNLTGNYIAQADMELQLSRANDALSLASITIAGAKMGGGWGAIVGFAVGVINLGINYGQQVATLNTNVSKLNTYANIMQDRANGIYSNESRGTYQ